LDSRIKQERSKSDHLPLQQLKKRQAKEEGRGVTRGKGVKRGTKEPTPRGTKEPTPRGNVCPLQRQRYL
jgi:hypothetical protein